MSWGEGSCSGLLWGAASRPPVSWMLEAQQSCAWQAGFWDGSLACGSVSAPPACAGLLPWLAVAAGSALPLGRTCRLICPSPLPGRAVPHHRPRQRLRVLLTNGRLLCSRGQGRGAGPVGGAGQGVLSSNRAPGGLVGMACKWAHVSAVVSCPPLLGCLLPGGWRALHAPALGFKRARQPHCHICPCLPQQVILNESTPVYVWMSLLPIIAGCSLAAMKEVGVAGRSCCCGATLIVVWD